MAHDPKYFGMRLRALRAEKGWSREFVVRALAARGMRRGVACLRDIEQGRNNPGWDTVLIIADLFQVSVESFCEPPDTTPPKPKVGRPRNTRISSYLCDRCMAGK